MNPETSMSTVTVKGQIVIPSKLRKKVGLKKGTRIYLEERNGDIIVHPATSGFYDRVCGILQGSSLTQALRDARRQDKIREDR